MPNPPRNTSPLPALSVAHARGELPPVGLHAGTGPNAKRVRAELIIGALRSRALELSDVIPAQADVERQPARGMPVVLHKNVGLPGAIVLVIETKLPGNGGGNALQKAGQAVRRRTCRGSAPCELAGAILGLVIVHLAPDYAAAYLDVVGVVSPRQHALVLEHVVDVVNGNRGAVAERVAASLPGVPIDRDIQQARNKLVYVGSGNAELIRKVSALIRRERRNIQPRESALHFHDHRGTEDVNKIQHVRIRVFGRVPRINAVARIDGAHFG